MRGGGYVLCRFFFCEKVKVIFVFELIEIRKIPSFKYFKKKKKRLGKLKKKPLPLPSSSTKYERRGRKNMGLHGCFFALQSWRRGGGIIMLV